MQDTADCRDANCRPLVELDADETAVSGRRSCLSVGGDCLYIGAKGLHLASSQGQVTTLSDQSFGMDVWKTLDPSRMQIEMAHGHLFLSTDRVAYAWPFRLDESRQLPVDVSMLSIVPKHWLTDEQGNLYFIVGNIAYQFNAGSKRLPGRWKQSPQVSENRQVLSSVYTQHIGKKQGNKLKIFSNDKLVSSRPLVEGLTRVRGQARRCMQLEISGPVPVCELAYGASVNRFGGEQ